MSILKALHRYAATGQGDVKALSGEFQGLLRLRVGSHRVLFDESEFGTFSQPRCAKVAWSPSPRRHVRCHTPAHRNPHRLHQ